MPDRPSEVLLCGRYQDRVVDEGGVLRFAERLCIYDLTIVPTSLVYPVTRRRTDASSVMAGEGPPSTTFPDLSRRLPRLYQSEFDGLTDEARIGDAARRRAASPHPAGTPAVAC